MLRVRTQHGYRLSHLLPIATHLRVTNLPMFSRPVSPGQLVLSHGAAANQSQFVRPTSEGGNKQRFSDPFEGIRSCQPVLNGC
jgi:hypothetical protein